MNKLIELNQNKKKQLTPPDFGRVITLTDGKSDVNFVANNSLSSTTTISTKIKKISFSQQTNEKRSNVYHQIL